MKYLTIAIWLFVGITLKSYKTKHENSFFVVQNLRIAFTKAGFILILVIP